MFVKGEEDGFHLSDADPRVGIDEMLKSGQCRALHVVGQHDEDFLRVDVDVSSLHLETKEGEPDGKGAIATTREVSDVDREVEFDEWLSRCQLQPLMLAVAVAIVLIVARDVVVTVVVDARKRVETIDWLLLVELKSVLAIDGWRR